MSGKVMGNMLKFIKEIVFGTQYFQFSVQKGESTLAARGMGPYSARNLKIAKKKRNNISSDPWRFLGIYQ